LQVKFTATVPVPATTTPNVQTQTTCTPVQGTDQVNCNSARRTGGPHYIYTSTVEASDGNTYDIVCRLGAGGKFLQGAGNGMAAQSGIASYGGCNVPVGGTYSARIEGGLLKIVDPKGRERPFNIVATRSPSSLTNSTQIVSAWAQPTSGQASNKPIELGPPDFPKEVEISLALSQSERAFQQYKDAIELETRLPSMKPGDLKSDRETLEAATTVLGRLKKNPDEFHSSLGLLLFSSLDDASRNAVVCSNTGNTDIIARLAGGKQMDDPTIIGIVDIVKTCAYVSAQLYTVSENVHDLVMREIDGLVLQEQQTMQVLTKCADEVKGLRVK
jgi:hypothetical protein